MAYDTPAAMRQAIEARLSSQARELRVDLQRLRRSVVFERLVVRLDTSEPGLWVVKGGMALEWRLGNRARATRDLDLSVRLEGIAGAELRDRVIEALSRDPEGDRFVFAVGRSEPLPADAAGRPGHRFSVQADLDGRMFATVKLDVVARSSEIHATERLRLPGRLAFAGILPREVEAVAPIQQFAEKLHALTRAYPSGENTRVRDLVDLALLIEEGLVDPERAYAVARPLFELRSTHPVPEDIPDPPTSWLARYASMASELSVQAKTLDEAMSVLRRFWISARRGR